MRVLIVGAGIAGLSTAWALTRAGAEVVLVEQGEIPNPDAASGDQHRIIRRAYGPMRGYQRRMGAGFDAWEALWSDLGARHVVETGMLMISTRQGDDAEIARARLEQDGFPVESVPAARAAARWPVLDPDAFRFAAYSPDGGVLLCRKIAADMERWLRDKGAELRPRSEVVSVDFDAASARLSTGEILSADRLVVTAGAWAVRLAPALTRHVAAHLTSAVYLAPPPELAEAWTRMPAFLDTGNEADCYLLPPVAGTGLKIGATALRRLHVDPDAPRPDVTLTEMESALKLLSPPFAQHQRYRVTEIRRCPYAFTPDEHFLLAERGRGALLSACSGHGYKFGPANGLALAAGLIADDLAPARAFIEGRD